MYRPWQVCLVNFPNPYLFCSKENLLPTPHGAIWLSLRPTLIAPWFPKPHQSWNTAEVLPNKIQDVCYCLSHFWSCFKSGDLNIVKVDTDEYWLQNENVLDAWFFDGLCAVLQTTALKGNGEEIKRHRKSQYWFLCGFRKMHTWKEALRKHNRSTGEEFGLMEWEKLVIYLVRSCRKRIVVWQKKKKCRMGRLLLRG